jgi:lipopolysaccharide export system permease protein
MAVRIPGIGTVLDRYVTFQLFQVVVFCVLLFTVIWLAPETLFKLIQNMFAGKLTPTQAGTMFLYHMPAVLQQSIPMAVFLGSLFLFRRLSSNFELIAMFATGIRPVRLLVPVLLVGAVFAGLHFFIQERVAPATGPRLAALYRENGLTEQQDNNFVFVEKNRQSGQPEKFFLIGQTENGQALRDFIILYYSATEQGGVQIARILRAPTGVWNPSVKAWQLFDGVDYELNEEGIYREIRQFKEQWVSTSGYLVKLLQYSQEGPMDMDWKTLRKYVQLLRDGGQLQDVRFYEMRLQQKLALPAASLVLVILGAMIGMEKVRTNRAYSLTYGALILFCYSITIPFSANLGTLGILPPELVAWLPLLFASLVAVGILQIRWREG